MGFKKVLLLILLAGSVFTLSGCVLQKEETPTENLSPVPTIVETTKPVNINFTQTGNLTKEGQPASSSNWLLLYEQPGNPALTVTLEFNKKSICDTSGVETKCDESKFNPGDRVKIEGERDGETVTVSKLTLLAE